MTTTTGDWLPLFPEVKDWRIFRDAGLALVFPSACSQRWLHFFLAATMLQHSEPTLDSIFLVDNDNYLKKKVLFCSRYLSIN